MEQIAYDDAMKRADEERVQKRINKSAATMEKIAGLMPTDEEIREVLSQSVNGRALLLWMPAITKDDLFQMQLNKVINNRLEINGRRMHKFLQERCVEIIPQEEKAKFSTAVDPRADYCYDGKFS